LLGGLKENAAAERFSPAAGWDLKRLQQTVLKAGARVVAFNDVCGEDTQRTGKGLPPPRITSSG